MADDWGGVMVMALIVGGGIWLLKTHPEFLIPKQTQPKETPMLPTTGKVSAADKPSAPTRAPATTPAISTAAAGKTIYPATGKSMVAKDTGKTIRHYASGKPSSPTSERAVDCPFDAYEATGFMDIPGDELSLKMYGPHHTDSTRAWYIVNVKNGSTGFGHEDPHPKTGKFEQAGASPGNFGSKQIGVKGVIWPSGSGAHVEGWINSDGSGWKKALSANNPVGKAYKKSTPQEVLFRIDTRPVNWGTTIVQEIKPPGAVAGYAKADYYSFDAESDSVTYEGEPDVPVEDSCSDDENDEYMTVDQRIMAQTRASYYAGGIFSSGTDFI